MIHAFFNPGQTATFNEIAPRKDSTFEVHYFGIHGLGHSIRTILAVSGAKFTSVIPEDWAAEKPKKPFGLIPTLKETSADGKVLEIAEIDAISRYLSRKFGYLGTNAFEAAVIDQFYSSSRSVHGAITTKYFDAKTPEAKAEVKTALMEHHIEAWLANHERHLADNGSNGHYLEEALSLADFATASVVDLVNVLWGEDTITEKKYPAVWKVYANIVRTPSYVAWTQTESYKTLTEGNRKVLGY
ncbi:hypothetical protein BG006_005921 [Podila minutissima]|uniref:Glutathione S-transferase n=1 Tax=Podila minutissima TaxID=64525 RepID=A0A9P5SSY4_9FUNG|nr:hypothetical protein BG006_005921 [Podila minutissima]